MQKDQMHRVGNEVARREVGIPQRALVLLCGLGATCGLTGCLVAGYSSSGGGFIWPGGLGLVVMLLVLFFLMRRR